MLYYKAVQSNKSDLSIIISENNQRFSLGTMISETDTACIQSNQ